MSNGQLKRRNNNSRRKNGVGKSIEKSQANGFARSSTDREYCSINTSLDRRMQTVAVLWYTASFIIMTTLTLFTMVNPFMWWFVVPYALYYIIDRTPSNGNAVRRYSKRFRSLGFWNYYKDYFPISLHKTVNLEPTFTKVDDKQLDFETKKTLDEHPSFHNVSPRKWWNPFGKSMETVKPTGPRYIFGYHPHGVAAFGVFGAFATEACGWSEMFPGIPTCLLTLVNQFQIPVYRDYLMALGISSVARKNALKVLAKNHSVVIVIGGASESLMTQFGSSDIILNKRKGFVKLALQTGNVNIVPVYAFGETDCYKVLKPAKDSKLRRFQLWLKKNYSFTIPLFFARGIFNYDFGLLPFRTPINVVVGRPIYIKDKIEHPNIEQIDHFHSLYIKELKTIYDNNKEKFNCADTTLNIVE